jgi:hypothetical protein
LRRSSVKRDVPARLMGDDFRDEEQTAAPRRRSRSWESGIPAGQERSVSYETEERYWTDYLRVALPVIGLLLMLALFWWWAQEFIGDNADPDDIAEVTRTAQVATMPTPSPTATQQVAVRATEQTENPTEEPGSGDGTPSDGGDDNQDCGFTRRQVVVVTEDGVNLREEPDASQDNVITQLDAQTVLSIVDDCYEEDAEGNRFWRVRNNETAETGYISEDFIEAEESDD